MSVYDDVKKAITEFLLPEMKAEIAAVNGRIDTLKERVDQSERRANERHQAIMTQLDSMGKLSEARFTAIMRELALDKRVSDLERTREEEKKGSSN